MNYWCKCDYRLNNSTDPDLVTLRVYSEKEWQDIVKGGVIHFDELPDCTVYMWRCPKCERLYVFEDNKVVKYYVLHDIDEISENNRKLLIRYYKCKCGDTLNCQNLNDTVRWRVYSDPEWWEIFTEDVRMFNPADIPPPSVDVWRCSKCERVYVFKENTLIKYYVSHNLKEIID